MDTFFWGQLFLLAAETKELTPLEYIFEKNFINTAILFGALFYFGRGLLAKILGERRSKIAEQLTEVEQRLKQAEQELAIQKRNLAQAQNEANLIRSRAQESAKRVREEILTQIEVDIARMRQDSQNELTSERDRVIAQLRRLTLERTFQQVETDLPGILDSDLQARLIDQGIYMLDQRLELDRAG